MRKHYVEFIYPGLLFNRVVTREVASPETDVSIPPGCCGYVRYAREALAAGGELLLGERRDESPFILSDRYLHELA